MNFFTMLMATAAVGAANPTHAADEKKVDAQVEYKKDGGYESTRTTKQTTDDGTTYKTKSEVDVDVDAAGRVDKKITTETVADPKGLMNKEKAVSETEFEEKERGGYTQTTIRKYKDANGTDVSLKTVTDVEIDKDGNVITTATTERTVNPEGLMNQTTTKSKTKSVNGKVIEQSKKTD